MERKTVSELVLILLIAGIFTLEFNMQSGRAEPRTWTVDDDEPADFHSIQEAVNAASPGDTIYVYNGTYYEHVVVNKSVTVVGENKITTIIDGSRIGRVVRVTASHVSIRGFTIRNSGPAPCGRGYGGIFLDGNYGGVIKDNIIANGSGGIEMFRSHNNTIESNNILNNWNFGIELYDSDENMISNNRVMNNSYGIFFYFGSNGNEANSNTMSKNRYGICFEYARRNTLRNNNLTGNRYGLRMGLGIGPEDFNQDIDTSNLINGKPICYLVKRENVVIDLSTFPTGVGYLGIISSKNVTARNLSIAANSQNVLLAYTTDSTLQRIIIRDGYYGVQFVKSNRNVVTDCELYSYNGVFLESSDNNLIFNNIISSDGSGIELYFGVTGNTLSSNKISGPVFGITSYTCFNNTITKNVVSNCSSGIFLRGSNNIITENKISYCEHSGVHIALSNFTVVSGNLLTHNGMGIWINKGDHNTIFGNTLISNDHGFDVRYCNNNTFYQNNVINNTIQAYLVDTINEWDNGYPSGGNYWSDYQKRYPDAKELDNSGIWDIPYVIDEDNQDNYPLIEPWSAKLQTPSEALEELIETTVTLDLPKGIENSLTFKLKGALHVLDIGNENGAMHKLMAFINQVEAQRDKKLTDDQADYLIAEAQRIIDLIEG